MPNILKAPAKVNAARNFLKDFYDASTPDRMYVGLGDHGGEWGDPNAPDAPIDSFDEEQTFWQNLIGIGLISNLNDTDMVVPRTDWVSGGTYVLFNEASDTGSGTFDKTGGRNFYVVNTEAAAKVYILEGINVGAGLYDGTSTEEPTHTSPTAVEELDGYQWAYIYSIGAGLDVGTNLFTPTWMPVATTAPAYAIGTAYSQGDLAYGDDSGNYYSTQIYQVQSGGATSTGATMDADGANTWIEWTGDQRVGGFFVGCTLSFPDETATGGEILSVAYRQVALLRNPKDNLGARISAQWKGSAFEAFATLSRGVVMTLDNRGTITRSAGQTETVRLILEF